MRRLPDGVGTQAASSIFSAISLLHSAAPLARAWPSAFPARSALTPWVEELSAHPRLPANRGRHAFWASMTGPGAVGAATGRSSSILSKTKWSISCLIGSLRRWRAGFATILASRSLHATGLALMPTVFARALQAQSRSQIGGISCAIFLMRFSP